MINNVTFIIRSIGERTEDICKELILDFCDEKDVFVVRNITPFSKAVEESFKIGIENGKRWTITVDADVLLWKEKTENYIKRIENLIDQGKELDDKFFCAEAYLIDCFRATAGLVGGFHFYNTHHLKEAMQYTNNSAGRPETFVKREMSKRGYCTYAIMDIVGIHDYFQSYSDLVKKGMLQARKHSNIEEIKRNLKARNDSEYYKWFVLGTELSSKYYKEIMPDDDLLATIVKKENISFPEQPLLKTEEVNSKMNELKDFVIYQKLFMPNEKEKERIKDRLSIRLKRRLNKHGTGLKC